MAGATFQTVKQIVEELHHGSFIDEMTVKWLSQTPNPGADPGFFLGGGALVSCSSSTPINHIVLFFAEYRLY